MFSRRMVLSFALVTSLAAAQLAASSVAARWGGPGEGQAVTVAAQAEHVPAGAR